MLHIGLSMWYDAGVLRSIFWLAKTSICFTLQ